MSRSSESCALCCGTALSESLLKTEACKFEGGLDQYAALETHLLQPSLPSAPASSFMGSAVDRKSCKAGSSMVCTVAAVCYSLRNLGHVVHIVQGEQVDIVELIETTVASSGGRECVVVSVSAGTAGASIQHTIYSSLVLEGRAVTEDLAMKTVLSLQSTSRGLVWYWSAGLLGYSYILNSDESSMWALSSGSLEYTQELCTSKVTLPSSAKQNFRVLPFFYCDSEPLSFVVMGTGGVSGFCRDDLTVEAAALSRLLANRAYSSVASTGRCFCCEYMTNLHAEFHKKGRNNTTETHRLKLSRQFWQITKKS